MPALSPADLEHFLAYGFVTVPDCLDATVRREWVDATWRRVGYDPADPATWAEERVHLPDQRHRPITEIAPRAWDAICQLMGGEERVRRPLLWSDALIVNYRQGADQPWVPPSPAAPGWHKDGDFFMHYLDSPEQGLLTIVLWDDVVHQGGPTYLAADSVAVVARHLADHPAGVNPIAHEQPALGPGFPMEALIARCRDFRAATGRAGDVILMHPYLLHASSQNLLRRPRFISNPPVACAEPLRFDRARWDDHSPVEQAVLRGLGVARYPFRAIGPRRAVVPKRVAAFARRREEEARRALR